VVQKYEPSNYLASSRLLEGNYFCQKEGCAYKMVKKAEDKCDDSNKVKTAKKYLTDARDSLKEMRGAFKDMGCLKNSPQNPAGKTYFIPTETLLDISHTYKRAFSLRF